MGLFEEAIGNGDWVVIFMSILFVIKHTSNVWLDCIFKIAVQSNNRLIQRRRVKLSGLMCGRMPEARELLDTSEIHSQCFNLMNSNNEA